MAEAAVDKPATAQQLKYFCHECSVSVEIKSTADSTNLTCPICESSFIEELTQELENSQLQTEPSNDRDPLSFFGRSNPSQFLSSMLLRLGSHNPEDDNDIDSDDDDDLTGIFNFNRDNPPLTFPLHPGGSSSATNESSQPLPFHRFIEQLLGNLRAGSSLDHSGDSSEFLPSFPPFFQGFHGDPRDYAWGVDGIDNIITELLNQTEGTGPPPATKEDIDSLSSVVVTRDDIDQAAQCSVCLENFLCDETLKSLPCEHIFHTDCVIPWLQLHRTCPICRKSVGGEAAGCEKAAAPATQGAQHEPEADHASSMVGSNNDFLDASEEPVVQLLHANSRADSALLESLGDMAGSSVDEEN